MRLIPTARKLIFVCKHIQLLLTHVFPKLPQQTGVLAVLNRQPDRLYRPFRATGSVALRPQLLFVRSYAGHEKRVAFQFRARFQYITISAFAALAGKLISVSPW